MTEIHNGQLEQMENPDSSPGYPNIPHAQNVMRPPKVRKKNGTNQLLNSVSPGKKNSLPPQNLIGG